MEWYIVVTAQAVRPPTKVHKATLMMRFFANLVRINVHFALLTVVSASSSAQITLVHLTPCGPQVFPTVTCAIPASGAGNLMVVGFQIGGGVSTATTVRSVTDNVGNIYSEAGAARSIDTATGSIADIWFAKNSISGATTLSITPSATISNGGAVIWEFSGVDSLTPLDQTAVLNNQSASGSPSAGVITTTQSGEAVVSLAAVAGNVTGILGGSSFTNDSNLKGNGWAHLITNSPGTFAAQWSQSPAGTYASSSASFKALVSGGTGQSACDLNGDGAVNVIDVQLATNMNIGLLPCTANIAGPGVCSPLVIQQLKNTALTGVCTPAGSHTVSLNWTASTTPGISYNLYRSVVAGGPYSKLNPSALSSTSYVDSTVLAGQTYYYVTTAVDANNNESSNSNEASAVVPYP